MNFNLILKIYALIGTILFILKNIYIYKFWSNKEKESVKLDRLMLNVSNILIAIYAVGGIFWILMTNIDKQYASWYMEILESIILNRFLFISQFLFLLLIMGNITFLIIFSKYIKENKIIKTLFLISGLEIIISIGIFIMYYFVVA